MGEPGRPPPTALRLVCLYLAATLCVRPVLGGTCWSGVARPGGGGGGAKGGNAGGGAGRCTEATGVRVTREECCAGAASPAAAWSPPDLDHGELFFWRVLGGGVPCTPCRDTCEGVTCPADRTCALRGGAPRCVCASKCGGGARGGGNGARKRVCGTDGRTYRNACRLRKAACRRKARGAGALAVAYEGYCQSSCDKIRCPAGTRCLLDQNLQPHCAPCERRCAARASRRRRLCGADGATYASSCHLRAAACAAGRAIPIAYKGPCKADATCETARCPSGQRCLRAPPDPRAGAARCAQCASPCRARHLAAARPLCARNNVTYASWCEMTRDSCRRGEVVEARHPGRCEADEENYVS